MGSQLDFYVILGVRRAATQEEIRRAYLKAVQKLHPDKNVNPGETEMFLDVQQAYETLGDPARRAKYDASLPPAEPPPSPIQLDVQYSRTSLPRISEPQVVYALLTFAPAADLADSPAPPLNLCLVLDVSTSMQGEKMEIVKETAVQLLRRLRPHDVFSLVTFSDRAQVHIPPTRGGEARRAESKVHMLRAEGGTEIFQGLEAGVRETRRSLEPTSINHVILLTDGQTYGDERNCLELAEVAAADGIGISGLGIGNGWNDAFLDTLAARAGGSCIYVADPQDITRRLLARFDQLNELFSSETRLEFTLPPGLELSYAFRLQPDPAPLAMQSPLTLGSIQRHMPLQILLEFHLAELSGAETDLVLLDGELTAILPSIASALRQDPRSQTSQGDPLPGQRPPSRSTGSAGEASLAIVLQRPVRDQADPTPPPAVLVQAMSRVTLYRMQERARREVQEGKFEQATQRLKHLATHLLSQGEQALSRTVLLEVEHIEQEKSFSENGEKDIKFGTRGLMARKTRDSVLPESPE